MDDVLTRRQNRKILVNLSLSEEQTVFQIQSRNVIAIVEPQDIVSHVLERTVPGIVDESEGICGASVEKLMTPNHHLSERF